MTRTISPTDKLSHAKTYMEVPLYVIMHQEADNDGETISAWVRKLVLKELIARGKVSDELILKLAGGG